MKTIAIILLLLARGYCRIVFPDEFEALRLNQTYQGRLPFPTLPTTLEKPISQNIPATTYIDGNSIKVLLPTKTELYSTQTSLLRSNTKFNNIKYQTNYVNDLLARSVTRFALRMNHAIAERRASVPQVEPNNVVFSPINLMSILAIIMAAATGRTFDESVNVLGFDSDFDVTRHSGMIHEFFGRLLNSVESISKMSMNESTTNDAEISIAGGIFIQNGYSIRPEFQDIAENIYKNDVISVDFQHQQMAAQNIINNWVDSETRGKIRDILHDLPEENTKVILTSALFFNGEWNQHFISGATNRKPFFLSSGRTVDIYMMYNGGTFPFYEDKRLGVKILGLPYKKIDDISLTNTNNTLRFEATMYIMLPTSSNTNAINNLQSHLSADIIDLLISRMKNETCIIGIPRMKLSTTMNLNYELQSLGLTSLFNPAVANLGLLSSGLNTTLFTSADDNPVLVSRLNADELTTVASNKDFTGKKNYIMYKDSKNGYVVEQWDNGLNLRKVRRDYREKRRTLEEIGKSRRNTTHYETTGNADIKQMKDSTFNDNPYLFGQFNRNKRQNQPTKENIFQFIESQKYKSNGLDALRNSAHLVNPGLYVSDVLHRVEIDVTETGTVAAAATAVLIRRDGNQKRFIAKRPFLFFIRHDPTKLILFWATINKPTPNFS